MIHERARRAQSNRTLPPAPPAAGAPGTSKPSAGRVERLVDEAVGLGVLLTTDVAQLDVSETGEETLHLAVEHLQRHLLDLVRALDLADDELAVEETGEALRPRARAPARARSPAPGTRPRCWWRARSSCRTRRRVRRRVRAGALRWPPARDCRASRRRCRGGRWQVWMSADRERPQSGSGHRKGPQTKRSAAAATRRQRSPSPAAPPSARRRAGGGRSRAARRRRAPRRARRSSAARAPPRSGRAARRPARGRRRAPRAPRGT